MKSVWVAVAAVAAAALAGCATDGAADGAAGDGAAAVEAGAGAAAAAQGASPQQIVAARQAAFHLTAATMGAMETAIERGEDPKGHTYGARGVARWARALPGAFPSATASVTPSRARPEIWTDKPDFEARAAAFATAADALAAAAASGDKAAFKAQYEATGATCAACHEAFQVPRGR